MKKKISKKILILSVLGFFIALFGFSYAKYISSSVWNYYLTSKGFYLSSDSLDVTPLKNVNKAWDGGSTYFNISNNLNSDVITSYDIGYNVTCSVKDNPSINCYLNGGTSATTEGVLSAFQICVNNTEDGVEVSNLNKTDCELAGYDWTNQVATKQLYFDLESASNIDEATVEIELISTYPYKKTLIGDFYLQKGTAESDSMSLGYNDFNEYGVLTISNPSLSNKCAKISWNVNDLHFGSDVSSVISYNSTNDFISDANIEVLSKNSKSFIFYKTNFSNNFTTNAFVLEEIDC